MASGQKTEVKLAPELEAIATTACEQLRAKADGDPQREGTEVLRAVERAAQRKREAERTHEQAVGRAARLGLVQRDIPAAAHVAHGTIRAVLTRAQPAMADRAASTFIGATNDRDAEQQPSVSA